MNNIDDFFSDAAVNAFVSGIDVDVTGITGGPTDDEGKRELAEALLESDEMLLSSLLGQEFEKDIKAGKYSHLTLDQVAEILYQSELASMMYPKDKTIINGFLTDNKNQQEYHDQDLIDITRMFIKLQI
ncbi:UNKNOWN [Stylonychia lemnae]|uniref:Uncharacterized protein n=1 Tax=Stylonychia lemnae TaxID=5949 RepID=A0A078AB61_STYLE|nr:UNKNOWN [Stylonychia lemnae]|eukprot:CDW79530.1 UNKNOWN [Stylonychia lemnae]